MEEYLDFENKYMILSEESEQLQYKINIRSQTFHYHWGQRKLGMVLLQFLNLYLDLEKTPNPKVVYAGAAPGNNIKFVSILYPMVEWFLYDPRKIELQETDKIHIFQQYFEDKDAERYRTDEESERVYFLSDIRRYSPSHFGELSQLYEKSILEDMFMQQEWCKIMNPVASQLKFRLPYPNYEISTVKYLQGIIYIQPWAPIVTTETRLVVTDVTKYTTYNVLEYQNMLYFINKQVRNNYKFKNPFTKNGDTTIYKNELLNDLDSRLEADIFIQYLYKFKQKVNYINFVKLVELFNNLLAQATSFSLELRRLIDQGVDVKDKWKLKREEEDDFEEN